MDLGVGEVHELIGIGVEDAGRGAGAKREDRAVAARHPAFGQAHGEDEKIRFFKYVSDGLQVAFAGNLKLVQILEGLGLKRRAERVDDTALLAPGGFLRGEMAIGPVEGLQQLAHGVDVAIARGIDPVIERAMQMRGQQRRGGLVIAEGEAAGLELAGDMLGKAASGGDDPVALRQVELLFVKIDKRKRATRADRGAPEGAFGQTGIGIVAHGRCP